MRRPEWLTEINSPSLAQTEYDILNIRSFISLLVPALLDDFPRGRRKTQLLSLSWLGGTFTLRHHEMDVQIRNVWEGKFPCKNLVDEAVRAKV